MTSILFFAGGGNSSLPNTTNLFRSLIGSVKAGGKFVKAFLLVNLRILLVELRLYLSEI